MNTKIYWINKFENDARLGIMAKPRGDLWLEEEIASLEKQGVDVLVSLLERSEIFELNLQKEGELCNVYGLEFINFSIPDREIPKSESQTDLLIDNLSGKISKGLSVVIHCRMGIGRSSIIAASILLKYNYQADQIIDRISNIRGIKVPDTERQLNWLKSKKENK